MFWIMPYHALHPDIFAYVYSIIMSAYLLDGRDFWYGFDLGDLGFALALTYFCSKSEDEFFFRGEVCNTPYVWTKFFEVICLILNLDL